MPGRWSYDASLHRIIHSSLCLSSQAWGIPLNLYECGNASVYQNYTYDPASKHFTTIAPANDPHKVLYDS